MRIDLYDGDWLVEVDGTEYVIIGNKDDGYDIGYNNTLYNSEDDILFSSNDFEECLVWLYNS